MTTDINNSKASAPSYELMEATQVDQNQNCIEVHGHRLELDTPYWTDAKITRISLYIFAAMCALGGVAVIGLSVTGVIPGPCAYLAVPLFGLAIASVCTAMQILDYKDPLELQAMKEAAPNLTYRQLVSKHGLGNITQYDIISIENLREKFFICIRGMRFCNFYREFSIEDLQLYGVVNGEEESRVLNNLKKRFEDKTSNLDAIYLEIDRKYPHRLNLKLTALDNCAQQAQAEYVRNMQTIEADWNKRLNRADTSQKTALEQKKTAAIARVKTDALKNLNATLEGIRIEKASLSRDQVAASQQLSWNQERETAFRENSVAFEAIETAFSHWLNLPR